MENGSSLLVVDLGRTEYGACWELQRSVAALRADRRLPDVLLLTEHEHVYTIGRTGSEDHLLAGEEELHTRGIALYHNDRGGDITYHGPGQLVGYPILHLDDHYHDLHRYLRDLEETVIRTLGDLGLAASRHPDYTGVWVAGEKICAIGVRSSRWVTTHGFALNVNTDLSLFGRIIPCGIFERGVTSVQRLLTREIPLEQIAGAAAGHFARVFGLTQRRITAGDFREVVRRGLAERLQDTPAVAAES